MAERAAWLVDRVLRNDIGWRQIVVTLPAPLAVGLRAGLSAAYPGELGGLVTFFVGLGE
jgi:hypothetical protein